MESDKTILQTHCRDTRLHQLAVFIYAEAPADTRRERNTQWATRNHSTRYRPGGRASP